ncbi:MAG TPA: GDP-mannose 4,6-dehydratase [Verrucomicrobiae bacterium]|jgi:GDP-4-dehydro-6-deoxy-D-mannose reductase|nr:GDP-mannose 4,6-dehydratase [Verrucomicrobiae bacterium]
MRALVTGASGFVGRHLTTALVDAGYDSVLGAGGPNDRGDFFPIDLSDGDTLRAALDVVRPDAVFHLAAQASVPDAQSDPATTYDVNVLGTARLLRAVRSYRDDGHAAPRIVFSSSADVYGVRDPGDYPLVETLEPRPANPYSASKVAAEAILQGEARSFGLDVVIARSFNHIGPGQNDRFAVASFALQLARIAAGARPLLAVGNLDAKRDFLDVRDVVAAYVALARDGKGGETYNVCSGDAFSLKRILGDLITIAHVAVEVRDDPARMRPADTPLLVGSSDKLRRATGWSPSVPMARSLRDIYEDARARVSKETA